MHLHGAVSRAAEPVVAADEAPLGPAVEPREGDDLLDRQPRDLGGPRGRPGPEMRGQLVRGVRVAPHVRPVRVALGEEDVHHRARQRAVGAGAEGQVHVGALRRARPVRVDHDERRAAPLRARDVRHDVDLSVDRIPAPDHDEVRVLAHLAEIHSALGASARDPSGVGQGDADRRVPARVAHDVAQAVDAVPLDQPHRARVEVRPHRLGPWRAAFSDERLRDRSSASSQEIRANWPGALRPHAPERVEQAVGVMHALGVAAHLLADDAGRVGVPRGAAHPADRAGVEPLHLERARARAVVRADGRDHLEPVAAPGGLAGPGGAATSGGVMDPRILRGVLRDNSHEPHPTWHRGDARASGQAHLDSREGRGHGRRR